MEFTDINSVYLVDGNYNFHGVEVSLDSDGNTINHESENISSDNMECLGSTSSQEASSSGNLETPSNFGRGVENMSQGGNNGYYLTTGVFNWSLAPNTHYENAIRVISIDPNRSSENSPSNNWFENLEEYYQYKFRLEDNCNNKVQYLQLLCNSNDSLELDRPEYIDINDVLPATLHTAPANSHSTSTQTTRVDLNAALDLKLEEDDDVIFIGEYNVDSQLNCTGNEEPNANQAVVETEVLLVPLPEPTPSTSTIKRRRRRKTFGEKRKNPVRKAQIEKASADLAEKLSIPPSVFNARIKKKAKVQPIIDPKNIRQSCRTTGAILRPPSPLNENDFREWPAEGMHERPVFNEETGTIHKLDYKGAGKQKKNESKALTPVNRELDSVEEEGSSGVTKRTRRSSKEDSQRFIQLTHDRFHMMFSYAEELKEFNKLAAFSKPHVQGEGLEPAKKTYEDERTELQENQSPSKGTKENAMMAKRFSKMIGGHQEENIQDVGRMLADTCVLYGLASGASGKSIAKYITSLTVPEGKSWLRKQI